MEHAASTDVVTFEVERVWKGAVKERSVVYQPASLQSNAKASSLLQTRYLVVAHRLDEAARRRLGVGDREDAFAAETCGEGKRPLAATEPELASLGPGRGPIEQEISVRRPKTVLPIRTRYVAPVYSDEARLAGVQGSVLVEVLIDESGNVTRSRIFRSIPLVDQAAIDAVEMWTFLPALVNGSRAAINITVAVAFPP